MSYSQNVSKLATDQKSKAKKGQKKNNADGFVFTLDKWAMLDRFLILGSEGNTYYCSEQKMVKKNAKNVEACLAEDGVRVVDRVVEISDAGRAPKNDPAIFVLALAFDSKDKATRDAASIALPKVCRISTDLFKFANELKGIRKWGATVRKAVANWYTSKTPDNLAYQVVKYQNREGWSHKDAFFLAHPQAGSPEQETLFRYIVRGMNFGPITIPAKGTRKASQYDAVDPSKLPRIVEGFEKVKNEKLVKNVVRLIKEYELTHEMIPTEAKVNPEVWETLLDHMPPNAVLRNLSTMTRVGLLQPLSPSLKKVQAILGDKGRIKKARLHPIAFLKALLTYKAGKGDKGKSTWTPIQQVIDLLDDGFYLAFDTIEPTGKNLFLGIDISGSMDRGCIAGVAGLTPRIASAAMAMATMRVEKNYTIMGFTSSTMGFVGGKWDNSGSNGLTNIPISPKMRLDRVVEEMQKLPMGGTDCSLPMVYALKQKLDVDGFHVYTDNETWAGEIHPFQALRHYRQASGKNAKSIVVGMTATKFTIADPSDAGMLDVVGFDTAAPQLMADFVRDD